MALPELRNPILDRLQAGDVALGMSIRLSRSPEIAHVAQATGHDFLFIDAQHSVFNVETIIHIAATALGCGIAAVVRVRSVDDPDVSLLLDNGVTGIVFPDVDTADQARRAVAVSRFAPLGRRSLTGSYPHFGFRPLPLDETAARLNAACFVACMIESPEGLANLDAIAAVEGFDVIHLGANDLLARWGKPGRFDDPEIVAAQERVVAAAAAHGKYAGLGGHRDVDGQLRSIRTGARFITTQSDIGLLMAGGAAWVKGLRAGSAEIVGVTPEQAPA